MESVEKQLMSLRDVWLRTGALHELQILNLNMWGLMILPKTKSSETKIDTDEWIVDFCLKPEFLAAFRTPKEAPLRCAYAERWVHQLLDGRVLVRVFWGKTPIFTGVRTVTATPSFEGTDFAAGAVVPEKSWKPKSGIKY